MSNPFYNASGAPVTGSAGASATIRSEFTAVAAGFALLPGTLTANKAVVINAGGTAMTITTGALALAGDFSTTGAFNTVFAQQASITITLPLTADTLVGRATTDTLTNKTLTSPTMTTPVLGTPTSGTLTNCTGLPIATGISGLAAGVATFLATPSSANLIAAVTDETGTGSLVFSASPTLSGTIGGALTFSGTHTLSAALTYGGVTLSNAVTGTGSMVLSASPTITGTLTAAAATFSGAVTLSAAITYGGVALSNSVTGTGSMVLSTNATLTTPNIGTPSAGTLTNCTGLLLSGIASNATTSWTPSDASGAGLTFTSVSCGYQVIGPLVHVWGTLTFPSTVDATNILIGNLPFTCKNATGIGGGFPVLGLSTDFGRLVPNSKTFNVYTSASTARANSAYSLGSLFFNFWYATA